MEQMNKIYSLNTILESAISIRTLNTQIERISENINNLDFISKYTKEDKLKDAISTCNDKYQLEIITNLNKMISEIKILEEKLDCSKSEIKALKSQLNLDLEF